MGKKASGNNRPLTQQEIWDDSALIQSWEEAVEEYRLYHSIQAKGQNADEVLVADEAEGLEREECFPSDEQNQESEEAANGLIPEEEEITDNKTAPDTQTANASYVDGFARVPHTVLNGPQPSASTIDGGNEGLKNLMMAWYYAGYYTGLYEGQHLANQR